MNDIIEEFLAESYEGLTQLEQDLVVLEKSPDTPGLLARIFRVVHTIKGTSGMLGFTRLESISHAGENLLSLLRNGAIAPTPQIVTGLLNLVDGLREILETIEETESEGNSDYSCLVSELKQLQQKPLPLGEKNVSVRCNAQNTDLSTRLSKASPSGKCHPHHIARPDKESPSYEKTPSYEKAPSHKKAPSSRQVPCYEKAPKQDPSYEQAPSYEKTPSYEKAPSHKKAQALSYEKAPSHKKVPSSKQISCYEKAPKQAPSCEQAPLINLSTQKKPIAEKTATKTKQAKYIKKQPKMSENTIRVNVQRLENLMNLVGELVLVRNQILQYVAGQDDCHCLGACQTLDLITTELQEGILKTRMQAISQIWNKFPRLVRDLSITMNKKVRLEMKGETAELDKTLLEAISAPLTHLIRNAIDHGLEPPEIRLAHGKTDEGKILLNAYHKDGQIYVEISDDGNGLDWNRIKQKAIHKRLISPEKASKISDEELIDLIFQPGFSTSDKITNMSGRGVGMDVVNTSIQKLGGTLEVQTKKGKGTLFRIKIPLTLTIVPALIITTAGDRYAIPTANLIELLRLDKEMMKKHIEKIQDIPIYRYRGNLLPLIYLNEEFQSKPLKRKQEAINIVILQADNRQFGLVVDQINDTQEIVVKPLTKQLTTISFFTGATILGDGCVSLILDIPSIALHAHVISEIHRSLPEKKDTDEKSYDQLSAFVLFRLNDRRLAIHLAMVSRLEQFPLAALEKAAGHDAVQYGEDILSLIYLRNILHSDTFESDPMQVIVCNQNESKVGLVVDNIIDIVEARIHLQKCSNRIGISGSAILNGHLTDILDIAAIIQAANLPSFVRNTG